MGAIIPYLGGSCLLSLAAQTSCQIPIMSSRLPLQLHTHGATSAPAPPSSHPSPHHLIRFNRRDVTPHAY